MSQWSYDAGITCGLIMSGRLREFDNSFPRQVPTITDYVSDRLKLWRGKSIPIGFHPRDYKAQAFYGTIEDSDSRVDIYYDRKQNQCWRRFIVTKELCHLLYESSGNLHLSSSVTEIDSLLSQILARIVVDQAATSEQAAILMAIEVLLPHSERPNVNKIISKGGDAIAIAKHYLLPAQMVSTYLHDNYSNLVERAAKRLASDALR